MYMAAKLIDLPASRQMRRAVNTTTNLCMLEMLSAASATIKVLPRTNQCQSHALL